MRASRLILVEGVPGSGKTTLAANIRAYLDARAFPSRLYSEGDLDHPADFESVAYFSCANYDALISRYAEYRDLLAEQTASRGDDRFVAYRKLERAHGQAIPADLIDELARHDVYETPEPETYCRLALERWQDFAAQAAESSQITIMECCFLQNPLTVLLGKHNVSVETAARHIRAMSDTARSLRPLLIYLWQRDTRATLERVAKERPQAWLDFLVGYFTGQGWGKAAGLKGFDGVVAFYEMRKAVELDLLRDLPLSSLVVDNSALDWAASQGQVMAFLDGALDA